MSEDRLLTIGEAAHRVGLRHAALRRAVQRGDLAAMKLCGRVRVDPDELDRWIRSNRIVVAPEATAGRRAA